MLSIDSYKPVDYIMDKENSKSPMVTINVSGCRYETRLSTLENYPDTLLGNEYKRKSYWNNQRQEYFFDRHRTCFESILYYYQSNGDLIRPNSISLDIFLKEISFFQLGQHAYDQVKQSENITEIIIPLMPKQHWRKRLWCLMEYPESSLLATLITIISMTVTFLSCLTLAFQTLPIFAGYSLNACLQQSNLSSNTTFIPICSDIFNSPFFIIQTICVGYFIIEFLIRLISTPSYKRFFTSILTYIDLAAIIPYFVYLGYAINSSFIHIDSKTIIAINILLILRLFRILKLFVIFKYLKALHTLGIAIKESFADFLGTFSGIILLAFLFGSACYVAEVQDNGAVFDSIPKSLYWAIITIMTVGYGDMYPITTAGRIIACGCALTGAATIGMLISVLVDRYQRIFNRKTYLINDNMSSIELIDTNNKSIYCKDNINDQLLINEQLSIEQTINRILNNNNQTNIYQQY
ncbi:unnamed protein product [Rotaria sp. Silwood1]|nr:unnamed protein product [Rotaria sp. Silwood1]CAF1592825.1 unnamed protein product [Rotaria sp. Silwood1]CAF3706480.1 unnamed protein product [Rotaria sp. Silwood1]CAF4963639.1 unnamed protein product [Rotaria sp. Silwood1]